MKRHYLATDRKTSNGPLIFILQELQRGKEREGEERKGKEERKEGVVKATRVGKTVCSREEKEHQASTQAERVIRTKKR